MNLLLDTHALVWFALDDAQLSSVAKSLIIDPANSKSISPASYWELAIKISLGKYKLSAPFDQFMDSAIQKNGFHIVPLEVKHANQLIALPFHHRDPFDRMMIVQAIVEGMSIVSNDPAIDAYPVKRLW
jgi:PIN domain nuclease of toxin-antitoxin system